MAGEMAPIVAENSKLTLGYVSIHCYCFKLFSLDQEKCCVRPCSRRVTAK